MALTTTRNTSERPGKQLYLGLAAAAVIFLGGLVATNAAGNAVAASDTAGLRVRGRAEDSADNTDGDAGDLSVNVKKGVFLFANSATDPVLAAHVGQYAYVEDDETVAIDSDNLIIAGRIIEVEDAGVWIDTADTGAGGVATLVAAPAAGLPANGVFAALNSTAVNPTKADFDALLAQCEILSDSHRALVASVTSLHTASVAAGIAKV